MANGAQKGKGWAMPSHGARRIVHFTPRSDGQVDLRAELLCGCTVDVVTAADRVLRTEDGLTIAVGKFPCPSGHPVVRPGATKG